MISPSYSYKEINLSTYFKIGNELYGTRCTGSDWNATLVPVKTPKPSNIKDRGVILLELIP